MRYCAYFQAKIDRPRVWFFTATLRSFEHLCFDRTLDKTQSLFEFFVPEDNKAFFTQLMRWYQEQGIAFEYKQLPNRLLDPEQFL
ncbi:MAG: hypothetical protein UV79_C0005G0027 [candidate division TM6 bacterium GW2011_GWF2_43_17]|nr:MAG: hypothetical protein UV79_C0005G0027 [candidate division TM6 bacterium GW2011_GWF2_43_17]HAU30042.1 hypothetical protein [Candidatus Dependentiae bacterium]